MRQWGLVVGIGNKGIRNWASTEVNYWAVTLFE